MQTILSVRAIDLCQERRNLSLRTVNRCGHTVTIVPLIRFYKACWIHYLLITILVQMDSYWWDKYYYFSPLYKGTQPYKRHDHRYHSFRLANVLQLIFKLPNNLSVLIELPLHLLGSLQELLVPLKNTFDSGKNIFNW